VPEWTAEIEVDAGLARRLIAGQFPGLAIASLAPFAEGWDNAVWLVNGELLFRFPGGPSRCRGWSVRWRCCPSSRRWCR